MSERSHINICASLKDPLSVALKARRALHAKLKVNLTHMTSFEGKGDLTFVYQELLCFLSLAHKEHCTLIHGSEAHQHTC